MLQSTVCVALNVAAMQGGSMWWASTICSIIVYPIAMCGITIDSTCNCMVDCPDYPTYPTNPLACTNLEIGLENLWVIKWPFSKNLTPKAWHQLSRPQFAPTKGSLAPFVHNIEKIFLDLEYFCTFKILMLWWVVVWPCWQLLLLSMIDTQCSTLSMHYYHPCSKLWCIVLACAP